MWARRGGGHGHQLCLRFLVISSLETTLIGPGGATQATQGNFLPGPASAMVRGDPCPLTPRGSARQRRLHSCPPYGWPTPLKARPSPKTTVFCFSVSGQKVGGRVAGRKSPVAAPLRGQLGPLGTGQSCRAQGGSWATPPIPLLGPVHVVQFSNYLEIVLAEKGIRFPPATEA